MRRIIPRITTRGRYDLTDGKTLKSGYSLYPKRSFESLYGQKEISIMIHGLRNNTAGAVNKFEIAKARLKKLGYMHPVIGFSYDSNTRGAHLKKTESRALLVGQKIAQKNGKNLAKFILDFAEKSPETKFRLLGHSLGSQVILSAVMYLAGRKTRSIIESIHFFGASIPADVPCSNTYGPHLQRIVDKKIINYYAPTDEVLSSSRGSKLLGLHGASDKMRISKYIQRRVRPKNHRFKSYAAVLKSFP